MQANGKIGLIPNPALAALKKTGMNGGPALRPPAGLGGGKPAPEPPETKSQGVSRDGGLRALPSRGKYQPVYREMLAAKFIRRLSAHVGKINVLGK